MKIIESRIWEYGSKLYDILIINLLWLLFSIPLLTIGPATHAAVQTMKEIESENGKNIWMTFIKYFKIKVFSIMLAFNTILGIGITSAYFALEGLKSFNYIQIALSVFVLIETIIALFVISFLEDENAIDLIINSFILGNMHSPRVILAALLCGGILLSTLLMPMFLFISIGLCIYIINLVVNLNGKNMTISSR